MAEEIVTRFTADLSDLQAKVKAATATLEGYTETADEAGNAIGAQAKKTGDLEAKTRTLVASEQALTKASNETTKAIVQTGAKGVPAMDKLTASEKKATAEAKNLASAQAQVGKTTEGTGAKLSIFGRITQGLSGAFGRIKNSVVEFGRGAKAGFQEAISGVSRLGGGIGAATSSFGSFGGAALGVLGPVGIAVGAVATGLLAVARNTDAGQVAIDGIGRTSGLVFDRITGKVKDLFAVLSGDGQVGQIFQKLAAGAEFFIKTLSPIAPLLAILKVTGISDAFAEDVAEGQRLAALYDDLEDKQVAVNEATAKNQIIIDKNLAALRDGTKQTAERLKLAEEAAKAERENLQLRKDLLKEQLAVAESEAAGVKARKKEIPDELRDRISALKVALLNEERESIATQERISARANNISEQDFQKQEALRAKQNAANEKAAQQEAQRIQKLSDLRAKAAEERKELEDDAIRRSTLGEGGQATLSTATFDIEVNTQKAIDAENAQAKELIALSKGTAEELAEIERNRVATIELIRAKGNDEILAAQQQFFGKELDAAKAASDRVEDAIRSDEERQRAAINQKYDNLLKDLDGLVLEEDALNEKRVRLNKKRQEELDKILEDSEKKRQELFADIGDALGDSIGESVGRLVEGNGAAIAEIQRGYQQQIADLEDFTGTEAELQAERIKIAQERDAALAAEKKKGNKELLVILLDGLQKALQIYITEVAIAQTAKGGAKGGIPGAIAGAAIGAAIAAVLSGLFNALKGSIAGAYTGERNIGGDGERPIWSGKDGYVRRVHKGEDIVRSSMAKKHRGPLDAIHDDKFDAWVAKNMALPTIDHAAIPQINAYLEGDTGQRMAASVMLAKYYDKNIVEATNGLRKEQRKTNELLELMVENKERERSTRSW